VSCGRIVAIVMTIQNEFLDQAGSPAEGHYGDTFTRRYGSMTPSVVMDGSPADVVTPRRRHAKITPRAPYVVVVDSHDDSREMYSEWLTRRGIRVTAVPTARDALAVINGALPDAVIASLRLSDGDAFALFSAIRASRHSVPIVALSTSMPDHERMGRWDAQAE
jgi:CheY-like chemotaxis protein